MARILVHDFSGHPFQVQLSRELARRGHDVLHVHCASYVTGKGAVEPTAADPPTFKSMGISLGRAWDRYAYAKRVVQEIQYAKRFTATASVFQPDRLVLSNVPLFALRSISRWAASERIHTSIWLQDLYSMAMAQEASRILPLGGGMVGRLFEWIERSILLCADHVIPISENFRAVLDLWGVDRSNVTVVPNWAPIDELPMVPRDNEWARQHDLTEDIVFLYSGTLGLKHDPRLLWELAHHFRDREDIRVAIISEGIGMNWLQDRQEETRLDNLLLLPYQPYDLLPGALGAADVLVGVLEPQAGEFSVPSKLLTYLCAGRAILASVPPTNDAHELVDGNDAGIAVAPDRTHEFLQAATRLAGSSELRESLGKNARRLAEREFDVSSKADAFENALGVSPVGP